MNKKNKTLVYDHFHKQKVEINNPNIIKGVIFSKGSKLIFGFFTKTYLNCFVEIEGVTHFAISREVFKIEDGFISCLDGIVRLKKEMFNDRNYSYETGDFKYRLDYNITSNAMSKKNKTLQAFDVKINKNTEDFYEALQGLSVGVEVETVNGFFPEDLLYKSNLVPLRDGSISGLEYVTTPMTEVKDFQIFINSLYELQHYVDINDTCALHFHFGNLPRTESFINALWILVSLIQEQLYELHQPYKMLNWGYKNKSYSKPLPVSVISQMNPGNTVTDNFELIYNYLAEVESYENRDRSLSNVAYHPQDSSGEHKWQIRNRYAIVNFIPLIFTNKKTVEFRISEATLNPQEIMLEMLLFSKIVNHAKRYEKQLNAFDKKTISKCCIYEIIKGTFSGHLSVYLGVRKDQVAYSYCKGSHTTDLNFNFNLLSGPTGYTIKDRVLLGYEKSNNITSWLKDTNMEDEDYANESYFDDED